MDIKAKALLDGPEYEASEDITVYPTFESMGLCEPLLRGILAHES